MSSAGSGVRALAAAPAQAIGRLVTNSARRPPLRGRRRRLQRRLRDEPVEPARQPPVALAQELHDGGHEHHAHDRRVDEDRRGQADADQLEEDLRAQREGAEDRDHDQRRRGDHARGAREPLRDRARACRARPGTPRARARAGTPRSPSRGRRGRANMITGMNGGTGVSRVDPDQLPGPAALGQQRHDAVGRADREQVHHAGLERRRRPSGRRRAAAGTRARPRRR